MRNVEIKAKVHDLDNICKIAEKLSGSQGTLIKQDDIFYTVNQGRLKMRFTDESGTLVRYERDDEEGPKLSDFDLLPLEITKAKQLDVMLSRCLGVRGRVIKERKLYMVGQTRVHIDTVQDLGLFMELEVMLRPEQSIEEGQEIARELQKQLGVKDEDLIDCAYMDLLDKQVVKAHS